MNYDDDGYAPDIEGQALKHYHERRRPTSERERELYEGFAVQDTQQWQQAQWEAVNAYERCTDYNAAVAEEMKTREPPDYAAWFTRDMAQADAEAELEAGS